VAPKVRHYQESSSNHNLKHSVRLVVNFEHEMSTRLLPVCIKYSTHELVWRRQLLCLSIWVKSMHMIKSCLQNKIQNRKYRNQRNFFT